jgi:branched-chain amino acid transport system ATP-binding protein
MLAISSLRVNYGKITAINSVSLEVKESEIVAIIGANGAGKTTTLKVISGLVKPAKGLVEFRGINITGKSPDRIVELGVAQVPEGRLLFSKMSVYENLLIGAFLRRNVNEIREGLDKVMGIFPILKDRVKQIAGTLSGGEQQMLAIARGLMSNPKLFLMDEPSLGLAPLIIEEIFRVIKELNAKGMTILLIEQNANKSLAVATRGYVMEVGNIVMSDTGMNLLSNEKIIHAYLGK